MKFDRRLILHFDWPLLFTTIIIAAIGFLNLYSATFNGKESMENPLYMKQLHWILLGIFLMFITLCIDYRFFERHAYTLYVVSLLLLILVFPFGKTVSGSKRWIQLGVSIQPSELFKITIILALSKYFKRQRIYNLDVFQGLLYPMLLMAVPVLLILKQPDLGTALLIILIFFSILIFNGIRIKTILGLFSLILCAFPFLWFVYLKEYQKMRILTFINPNLDPLDSGYHILQSKIAIGSGMFLGKGFLNGTQKQLQFLPEQHTDFIFSVLAEEWGFVGSVFILSLYLLLVLLSLRVNSNSIDAFGNIVTFGISSLFFWHIFINIGMSIGLVPVVGAPLPFLSYGGSSTLTFFVSIGLLLNISMRKFLF